MAPIDWNLAFGSDCDPRVIAARLTVCGLTPDFVETKPLIMALFVCFVLTGLPELDSRLSYSAESESDVWVSFNRAVPAVYYARKAITDQCFDRRSFERLDWVLKL